MMCCCVDSNETIVTAIERDNNWINITGLAVGLTYWFQVTSRNARGDERTSEPRIFTLTQRTGTTDWITGSDWRAGTR